MNERDVEKYTKKVETPEDDKQEEVKEEEEPVEKEESSDDQFDNEVDGGEWVTMENLYKHISGGNTQDLLENADNLLFAGTSAFETLAPVEDEEIKDADKKEDQQQDEEPDSNMPE